MPNIRSVDATDIAFQLMDAKGTHRINVSSIPASHNTVAKVENWLNTVGLPSISSGLYQVQVHIFSLAPFSATLFCADPGEVIPDNWWI